MRRIRRFSAVFATVGLAAWVSSTAPAIAAEAPDPAAAATGIPAATGPTGADPADEALQAAAAVPSDEGDLEPQAAAGQKPAKERTGTVQALVLEVTVTDGGETTTETVTWRAGEAEPPGVRSGKLTRVEVLTAARETVAGAPSARLHRLVRAGKLAPGDRVAFTGGGDAALAMTRKIPGRGGRLLALLGGLAALLLLAWVVLRGRDKVKQLVLGEDNRYSSSKFQVALWFAVLIAIYLSTLWLRWWGSFGALIADIGIPTNLLLLSGMSVLSFAGAKGIKQSQVATAQARHVRAMRTAAEVQAQATQVSAVAAQGSSSSAARRAAVLGAQAGVAQNEAKRAQETMEKMTSKGTTPRFPFDLVQDNDGNADLGSFQMLVVTVLAVATYLWTVLAWQGGPELVQATGLELPDVDTTILAAFGLGQGAYLTKKYAENPV